MQPLGGVPLVIRVAERVQSTACVDTLVVATDAQEIADAVSAAGFRAVLTAPSHESGTERVAEVASRAEFARFDLVVNIQGDEPFLPTDALTGALDRVLGGDDVGSAATPLDRADADDPARVKVVLDARGRALYFSRAPIPHIRDPAIRSDGLYWQHLGLYAFRRDVLARWVALPPGELERAEQLEQLRALQHGLTFGIARLRAPALPGIDTPDDLRRAEAHWQLTQGVPT
jgi:3-deoxy-manno-octulosonate cytidylyltransferase (CMP-KDO synthetase)